MRKRKRRSRKGVRSDRGGEYGTENKEQMIEEEKRAKKKVHDSSRVHVQLRVRAEKAE